LDVCAAIAKPTAYWIIYNLYICEINLADSVVDTQLFVVEVFRSKCKKAELTQENSERLHIRCNSKTVSHFLYYSPKFNDIK
jgi:hypothetical protein